MRWARYAAAVILGYAIWAVGLSGLVLAAWQQGVIPPTGLGAVAIVLLQVGLGAVVGFVAARVGGALGRVAAFTVAALVVAMTAMNIVLDVAIEPLWFKLTGIGLLAPAAVLVGLRATRD